MNGALPPNSALNFLRVEEHCFTSSLPTRVDPVKVTFLTRGSVHTVSPRIAVLSSAVMQLMTPAGIPALSASLQKVRVANGVSPAGLTTEVQPAAIAAAILREAIAIGSYKK